MNIKKYLFGVLLLGTTMGLTSCDLDEYNPSGEGADAVFETAQGMEGLVNQLYYNFRWKYFGREDPMLMLEGAGDIWVNVMDNPDYGRQMTRCVELTGNVGQVKNLWGRLYDNVNLANTVINRLPNCKGLSDEVRADFDGEARFTRAYNYWWIAEFWGGVELRTEETSSPVFTANRTDVKVFYDEVIIPDAEKAAQELPVEPYKGEIGRYTKKAAYALLARVCLTRAQYETVGSAEQKAFYQKAYDAAKFVMDNKAALGIKLYDTYDEIWQAKNNKSNTEFLLVCPFSSNPSLNPNSSKWNRNHIYFAPRFKDRAGITNTASSWEYPNEESRLMPTYYFQSLWEDWDARYDVIFQEDFPGANRRGSYTWAEDQANNFMAPKSIIGKTVPNGQTILRFTKKHVTDADREAAAQQGIAVVGINQLFDLNTLTPQGGARPMKVDFYPNRTTVQVSISYPRFNKYRIWDHDENGTILLTAANTSNGFADVPMMRYAEMPLIAAEAKIGLGDQAGAAQIINSEIRTQRIVRAGHSLSEAQVNASQMTVEWILEERARELCGEWLRWFDLKRTHKLKEYVRGHNPSYNSIDVIEDFNELWPIPLAYLDKLENGEEFGQNPGYDPYVKSSN